MKTVMEKLCERDVKILRQLATDYQLASCEPVNEERIQRWKEVNEMRASRPVVTINELPWHELNVAGELDLHGEDPWARAQENSLRMELYCWKHLPGDMVLNKFMSSAKVFHSTGYGLAEDVDIAVTDEHSGVVSRHFKPFIVEDKDLDKIQLAQVSYDEEQTQHNFELSQSVFGDIMPVQLVGKKGLWYTPWDNLIRWTGVENAMMDLYDRPEFINEAVSRLAKSSMAELDQMEALGLLSTNNDNVRVGSGAYGYGDLFGVSHDDAVQPNRMWGCSNAQIFSEVSPDMHWEFALRHDMPYLERFGANYYGCCEPLHQKIDILRRIPNLRKVSVSPWCDVSKMAAEMGSEVVLSVKPSPAIFAEEKWNPEKARRDIRKVLDQAQGCSVELVMKDVSTVNYEPQRLWDWARIAAEEVQK